jgi:hypothetical protein
VTHRTTLILVSLLASTTAFAQMRDPMDVARRIGMSDAAIERVKNGEVVVEDLEASSDKDLSLVLVVRLEAPLEEIFEFLLSDRLHAISTVTLSEGEIDPATFSMSGMTLPDEVLQQLVDDPEDTFYMSKGEQALIAAAAEKGKEAVQEAYRALLSKRARAYWEKGLPGIEPYAGDDRSPKVDLEHANAAARKLVKNPAVLAELDAIPSLSGGKARHRLSWAIQKGRDQAAPVLNHQIVYAENDGEVSIQRRFYSAYDYDALQILTGILPVSDRSSVAFYTNHTYTSQVAGFGGSAKRSIGRKLMQKELVAEMKRAQAAIAGN